MKMEKFNSKSFLYDFISDLKGESVVFIPNPGNAGDSLIAYSTYILLNECGIKYRVVDANEPVLEFLHNDVVIYGGGGNFIELYGNARRCLSMVHNVAKAVYILPHTIRGNEDLISVFDKRVTIFCRERQSYNFIKSINSNVNCYLADDVAFLLPVQNILNRSAELGYRSINLISMRSLKRLIRSILYFLTGRRARRVLNSFRTDIEGLGLNKGIHNIDLSQAFSGDSMTIIDCAETTFFIFKFISFFDLVRTDRLHVCIAAALLGKKVEFYDNSYGKNFNVFSYSMEERFPNVKFVFK